jgi:Protein of unknown function, DUF488
MQLLGGILVVCFPTRVVDMRTVPRSRHNPSIQSRHVARLTEDHRHRYTHMAELGGLFIRNFLDASDKLAGYIIPPTGQSSHSHSCERKKSTEV